MSSGTRPLRLLVLSQLPPGLGGGELQTLLQLREMVRLGHRVTAIDLTPRHEGPDEDTIDGVRILRVKTPRAPLLRALAYHRRIAALTRREGRDVDVAQHNHLGTGLVTAAPILKSLRVPSVVVVWGSAMKGVGPFADGWRFRAARRAARGAERQVVLATAAAANLAREGFDPARVRFIPNGIEIERFRPAQDADRAAPPPDPAWPASGPVAISVGRLVPAKGLDTLIDAWARLGGAHPRARLVLAGDGPLRGEIATRAREAGIGDRVVFLGARDDVPELLRRADLYVSASRTEGMSNALLEALGSGLPVVATRAGSAPDVVVDGACGFLVPIGAPDALADALGRLLEDADRRKRMGESARRRAVAEFSIGAIVRRYIEVYREIAAS
jgi:glycosyltransferase involved in cell wall biosynthesis